MEREIKFRAWTGSQMMYKDFYDRNWYDAPSPEGKCIRQTVPEHSKFKTMQFTGLKDKNRKEIYEGDVLLYKSTNMSSMIVKFIDGCFCGEGPFNTHPLSAYFKSNDFESIEIIGNIYENPEG